ncbi:hypothetical protein ACOSQ3_012770 [Xanthoceras sorbifolium]
MLLFYHSLKQTFSQWNDPLGFGLFLMKNQYPFVFICWNSQIHLQSDLGLCKDSYCREKDLLFEQLVRLFL